MHFVTLSCKIILTSIAETSVDGGCAYVFFDYFFSEIYLSECLEKPYVFLAGLLVESVFHRILLLPFNKVELAGVMRISTSGGP